MALKTCMNCGKKVRGLDRTSVILSSISLSGNKCFTYLCGRCGRNQKILTQMQKINDEKLCLMDGEISLDEYNEKIKEIKKKMM